MTFLKKHTKNNCILDKPHYFCAMHYSELFSEFNRDFVSNSKDIKWTDKSVLNLYKQMKALHTDNRNDIPAIMKHFTEEQKVLVNKLLEELDLLLLIKELNEIKVYYQINPDPRNNENESLYAKTVLPRFKNHQKRKYIGINFGTRAKFPSGWTESRKKEARLKLIKKGYQMLVEG
ncbi:MAG: hypothetical protein FJX80_12590 [Bacteroidetes bacterium]|nr:hypothetical protein [Bacteroidota bacterium]